MTYQEFIQNIIDTRGQWFSDFKQNHMLCERHHIIPRCLGGQPKKLSWKKHPNIIWLYPKEHFIAHKLLALENKNNYKLVKAFLMMAFPKGKTNRDYELTPDEYQELREVWSKICREHNFGLDENSHPWNYGKPMSLEQKKHLSEIKKGKKLKPHSLEARKRHSLANQKRLIEYPESFKGYGKGKKFITNGEIIKLINSNDELPDGFVYGQGKRKSYIIKDKQKYLDAHKGKTSGKNNGRYGKGYLTAGGNNGHATKRYFYKNKIFECRKEFIQYINNIQNISITNYVLKKWENNDNTLSEIYRKVLNDVRWELKSNENKIN